MKSHEIDWIALKVEGRIFYFYQNLSKLYKMYVSLYNFFSANFY